MTTARPTRRAFTAGLGAVGLSAALTPLLATPAAAAPARGVWRRRAAESYDAMQRHLYLPDVGLYREELDAAPYAYVWSMREATAATIDVDRLPPAGDLAEDVSAHLAALEHYWNADKGAYASYPPAPLGEGGDCFYDDNAVIGLEFIRRYRLSGDRRALDLAARVFEFLPGAWDTDPSPQIPGGMHWVDADWNPYRGGTNVTSLTSELAAHLYEETGEDRYLEWAERTYTWVRDAMRREDGLYANGILLDGTVEETLWTYNSGAMIGAAALLHRTTGDPFYLDAARTDAEGALGHWHGERLYEQPAIFNAIYFANLRLLDSVTTGRDRRIDEVISEYAEQIWEQNRDARTGLFRFQASGGGAPDPQQAVLTLHQAGAIQTFALAAWPRSDDGDAT